MTACERGRPQTGPHVSASAKTADVPILRTAGDRNESLVEQARILHEWRQQIDLIRRYEREAGLVEAGYQDGFLIGFEAGYRQGRRDADDEAALDWALLTAWVRSLGNSPTHLELKRRRGEA